MDFLRDAAARSPHDLALDEPGRKWSYAELDARVDRFATALRGELPGKGPVALLLENGGTLVTAVHVVARLERVVAPLSPKLTAFELADALRALDPSALLTEPATDEAGRSAAQSSGAHPEVADAASLEGVKPAHGQGAAEVHRETRAVAGPRAARDRDAPSTRDPSGAWAVIWTSGTAGRARGVLLTAGNLVASANSAAERLELGPRDRWYLGLSCAHVGGLALVTRAARLGAAVVTRGSFSAEAFNEFVDQGDITHASLVPTMLLRALDERGDRVAPSSLRCLLLGGANTPRSLVERALAARFPVALTYGLTEACSQVATAPPALVARKPGTVGAPLAGTQVRIDEAGEILVRGPTVAAGYVGAEQPMTDPDGWLHTGDLGELDEEGHLRVTGRRSERIVTGGVNVDPSEVEAVLRLHPGVHDVAVAGMPDPEWGEVVAAAVVPQSGRRLERTELDALARERLSAAKVPRRFLFLDELPRNANGKVDRAAVQRAIAGAIGA